MLNTQEGRLSWSIIHPRNPHKWLGFKIGFEELEGHREKGPQEGERFEQEGEGK